MYREYNSIAYVVAIYFQLMNFKYEDIPHEKFKTDNGMDNLNFSNIKNKNSGFR